MFLDFLPQLAVLPISDLSWLSQPEAWIALLTLTLLEIILGIDNIIFISILVDRLPKEKQAQGRFIGLAIAMITRLLLLFSITWIIGLTKPLFSVFGQGFTGKDMILILGGLFLLFKSTREIHHKLEGDMDDIHQKSKVPISYSSMLVQIALIDIVFSLDSVITAVGMANSLLVMIIAVMVSVGFMMIFAGAISDFINRHPTIKMLALSFLILIGCLLIVEGVAPAQAHELHLKNYIYFAMAFSVIVELLNIRISEKKKRRLAMNAEKK